MTPAARAAYVCARHEGRREGGGGGRAGGGERLTDAESTTWAGCRQGIIAVGMPSEHWTCTLCSEKVLVNDP